MNFKTLQSWIDAGKPLNSLVNCDNMDLMACLNDNYIDLVIVDPPYGIGDIRSSKKPLDKRSCKRYKGTREIYKKIDWNNAPPDEFYFKELRRVSKNHIMFGFQFYMKYLWSDLKGVIIHDFKDNSFSMSHADCAITNLQKRVTVFRYLWCGFKKEYKSELDKNRIHPCEKPNSLYRWLLQNYAKKGDIILDTHTGSASSIIACILEGFQYIGCELDTDYFNDSIKRIQPYLDQGRMF